MAGNLAKLWNTWAGAPSVLFPVRLPLVAPSFPVPVHVGERLGRHHFRFRSIFGAKIEAGRGTCANGSRAGPNGNRDTWSDQRVRLERGPISVRSLQLHLYCRSHPEWWITDSFDGPEDTYVHHKEDSANYNEGSSMMREATALVWLAVHACEIQNGRASESVI